MHTTAQKQKFYGWQLLAYLGIAYTIQIGFAFYGLPVIFPFMTKALGWSRGEIMLGFTIIAGLIGFSGPLAAVLINRFGARITMFTGGLIITASTVLIGFWGQTYTVFLVLCFPLGIGVCLATMLATQTVIVAWFNARRALALGLVLGGGAIGGFIAPQIISAAVLQSNENWRLGWFIIAILSVIGSLLAGFTIRNRPADMGQYSDNANPDEAQSTTTINKQRIKTYRTEVNWTLREAVKSPVLWFGMIALGANLFLWQIIQTQGPFHLRDRGFTASDAAFFYSLAIGLSILGRFASAALGDRIEPRFLLAGASILVLIGGILFWLVSPQVVWIAYLYPLLAGFGFGAAYVCLPTILGNYYGTGAFASINGIVFPVIAAIQAGATPLAGYLYDIQGSYFTILLVGIIGTAIASIIMFFCKPPQARAG